MPLRFLSGKDLLLTVPDRETEHFGLQKRFRGSAGEASRNQKSIVRNVSGISMIRLIRGEKNFWMRCKNFSRDNIRASKNITI